MLAITLVALLLQAQLQTRPATAPPRDRTTAEATGTAAIGGRVTNTEGRPLRRVQLRLTGEALPTGKTASTNSQGKYEFKDLPAGRYTLGASRAGYLFLSYGQSQPGEVPTPIELADGQALANVNLTLPHAGIISGRVTDETGEPLPGANVMAMQMRFFNGHRRLTPVRGNAITDDTGQYRLGSLDAGEYFVEASSRETWTADPPDTRMLGFLPTFFPSAPSPSDAQRVRVRLGQEASGIDISLQPGRVATISGTAFTSQGAPLGGDRVSLQYEIRGETFMAAFGGGGATVNPDGTFVFRNVAPAEYHVTVRTAGTAERPAEVASAIVQALGGDIDGVSLVTAPAIDVRGRVVVEQGATLPVPMTRVNVRAQAVDRDTAVSLSGSTSAGAARTDGTFELKGIAGAFRLMVAGLPAGWAVRRIDYNGQDVTTAPLQSRAAIDGITITLTDHFPTITGVIRDDKGSAVPSATALLVPTDPSLWAQDLQQIRTARLSQAGLFTLDGVRPGDYLAIALPSLRNNEWYDPDFLEALRARAKPVTIFEGQPKEIDLVLTDVNVSR